jgi:hypothetical protein
MVARVASLALLGALALEPQPSTPGQPLACEGAVSVLLNGAPLSSGCVLNIKAGNGIIALATADPAIGGTDLSFAYNSALVPTHDTIHADENYCESSNGTIVYTCKLPNKALLTYQRGQEFLVVTDATCAASCSLNIDILGPKAIKQADGLTDPGGLLIAGQARLIWYDGTVFRLM